MNDERTRDQLIQHQKNVHSKYRKRAWKNFAQVTGFMVLVIGLPIIGGETDPTAWMWVTMGVLWAGMLAMTVTSVVQSAEDVAKNGPDKGWDILWLAPGIAFLAASGIAGEAGVTPAQGAFLAVVLFVGYGFLAAKSIQSGQKMREIYRSRWQQATR